MCSGIVFTFCTAREVEKVRFIVLFKDRPRNAVWREEVDADINRVGRPAIVFYKENSRTSKRSLYWNTAEMISLACNNLAIGVEC